MFSGISEDDFVEIIKKLGMDISFGNSDLNGVMRETILDELPSIQFLVAGPGTGKTTTIIYRTLFLLFVKGVAPNSIIMTTFTKKAADMLRSKIQTRGVEILDIVNKELKDLKIDFNAIEIGTLDSLIKNWLTEAQVSEGMTSGIIDENGRKIIMTREYLKFTKGQRDKIGKYLIYNGVEDISKIKITPFNDGTGYRISKLLSLESRLIGDLVDIDTFKPKDKEFNFSHNITLLLIKNYWGKLREKNLFTFSTIALYFLVNSDKSVVPKKLMDAVFNKNDLMKELDMTEILSKFQYLFIDEYQDTNFIQEQIYFSIYDKIRNNSELNSLIIVGDDDQSIYRFRGSTVELFTQFPNRIMKYLGDSLNIKSRFLSVNYRSTSEIINLINAFISSSSHYQELRVASKPPLEIKSNVSKKYNVPLVLIADDDITKLSEKIVKFLEDLLHKGLDLNEDGDLFKLNKKNGLNDVIFLSSSVRERGDERNSSTTYLPYYMREELIKNDLSMFNPNGRRMIDILQIRQIMGLILLILDPNNKMVNSTNLKYSHKDVIMIWRDEIERFLERTEDEYLKTYVDLMQRKKKKNGDDWDYTTISVSNLLHDLLHWFPYFYEDKEGVAYFSSFLAILSQLTIVGTYGQTVVWDPKKPEIWEWSFDSILWNFVVPIITNTANINEKLVEVNDPKVLKLSTIHTSKGLEYPIVIVDIGSKTDQNRAHIKRDYFPEEGGSDVWISDKLMKYTNMNIEQFDPIKASFADVIRKFYVAYTRAESILILVGSKKVFGKILNGEQDLDKPIFVSHLGWDIGREDNRGLIWKNIERRCF